MDDLTLRYYDAEMRYLLEAGEEFARAHPEQAAMLNLDKAGARDPFVERLFEGFAFLMGRMREKLDDDLPELTEGVVSLLWPHYLRTIPSMSVVEFTPDWPEMKEPMTMAKGFEVLSGRSVKRARAAGTPPPKRSLCSRYPLSASAGHRYGWPVGDHAAL
jgi:type VI secretion system protein ImpG